MKTSYGQQLIDCNCNDCIHMVRDFDRYKKSLKFHEEIERKEFDKKKELGIIGNKAQFQFRKNTMINYGNCDKLNKPVSFIPNVCQIETQECFKHRRDD